MPLSKARNRARYHLDKMRKTGLQPTATQLIEPLSTNQRKYRLAELIATVIQPDKVNASHIISAIAEYNKMVGDYAPEKHAVVGKYDVYVHYEDKEGEDDV